VSPPPAPDTPRRGWGPLLLAAGATVATLVGARGPATPALDRHAAGLVGRPRGTAIDHAAGAVTDLGSVFGLTGVTATLAVAGHRRRAGEVLLSGGLAWGLAQAAKGFVERPRPYQADGSARLVSVPAGSSWPSGHTAVAAAMAGTLTPHLGLAGAVGAGVGVAVVAASRLYVGVHYLTDVVAGAAMGVLASRAATGVVDDLLDR